MAALWLFAGCGRLGFGAVADADRRIDDARSTDAFQCVHDPVWPVARSYPGVAFDEARSALVVHGGADLAGNGVAETFTWTPAGWQARTPVTPGPGVHFSAMTFSVAEARVVLVWRRRHHGGARRPVGVGRHDLDAARPVLAGKYRALSACGRATRTPRSS